MERDDPPGQVASQTAAEQERLRRLRLAEHLQNQPPPVTPTAVAKTRGTAWKVAGALAVAVAVGWGAMQALRPGIESVSTQQQAAWAAAWSAAGPQVAKMIPAAEVQAALDQMHLAPQQRQQLQQELDDGNTRLVYMTFTDVMAEDLDRIKMDTGDFATEVTILNKSTKVIFPEPPGGVVNVTGTYDGGGGITIAITSGDTPVNLPFMSVGQVVGIPVVVER